MKANRSKNLGLVKSHKVIDLNRNISARAGTRKNTKDQMSYSSRALWRDEITRMWMGQLNLPKQPNISAGLKNDNVSDDKDDGDDDDDDKFLSLFIKLVIHNDVQKIQKSHSHILHDLSKVHAYMKLVQFRTVGFHEAKWKIAERQLISRYWHVLWLLHHH